jgi:hypothetical protein
VPEPPALFIPTLSIIRMAQSSKHARPALIPVVAIILVLSGILTILYGIGEILESDGYLIIRTDNVIAPADAEEYFTPQGELLVDGLAQIVVGVGQLILAVGFWAVRRWAWAAVMTWQAFQLLIILGFFLWGDPPDWTLIFPILIVFLLNQTDLRRAFGVIERENEPTRPALRPRDVERF